MSQYLPSAPPGWTRPQPIQQDTGAAVFNIEDESARIAYLKSLGARNMDPPLVKSSHLKIIASGRVLPYSDMLAMQRELVVNCDQYGNEDPAAWAPTVDYTESDPNAKRIAMARAQSAVLAKAARITNSYKVNNAPTPTTPLPTEYPHGVFALEEIQKRLALMAEGKIPLQKS